MTPELYHHGVKGQKWGVRRYRNEDGSLTEEGKERMRKVGGKAKAAGIIGAIGGGIAGAVVTPTMLQRGAEFIEAVLQKSILKNNKRFLYDQGSEAAMRVVGALGGARLGYKIASNAALRVQGYPPKKYKQDVEDEKYGL